MPLEINKNILALFLVILPGLANSQIQLNIVPAKQATIGGSTVINAYIISNSKVKGPARLKIIIPEGWEAENYPGATVEAKQEGNELKYRWFEFPEKDTVNVSILIDLPKKQNKGEFLIEGEFDYLLEGKKMQVKATPQKAILKNYFSRY